MTTAPKTNKHNLPPPSQPRPGWPWAAPEPLAPHPAHWPRVTVVTPTFNQGSFIEETIRSVLLQDYANLEYFILDAGSTDETLEIVRRYEPWLAGWTSEPDRGQSHAILKGFQRASGDVITWLNSDDVFLPGALRAIGQAFAEHPDTWLVYGDGERINEASLITGRFTGERDYASLLKTGATIPQPAAFFRREAFFAVGGLDENLHHTMDLDLWLRLLQARPQAVYVPRALARLRFYPNSKTGSGHRRILGEFQQTLARHDTSEIPSVIEDWLAPAYVAQAFEALLAGDTEAGRQALALVLENMPRWTADPQRLPGAIARQAWSLAPGQSGADEPMLEFVERVCANLPSGPLAPDWVRQQTLRRLYPRLMLRQYRRRNWPALRKLSRCAARNDPETRKDPRLRSITRQAFWPPARRRPTAPAALGAQLKRQARRVLLAQVEPLEEGEAWPAGLAPCLLGLFDGLDWLAPAQQQAWATELQSRQDQVTGVFRAEPAATPEAKGPGPEDWHATYLALAGLRALKTPALAPLRFVEAWLAPDAAGLWLTGLDWSRPDQRGREIMALAGCLLLEGERSGDPRGRAAAGHMLDWLTRQQNTASGYWDLDEGHIPRVMAMPGAACLYPLYHALGRPVPHLERALETTLALQQPDGSFSVPGHPEAWTELAGVELLVKASLNSDFRAEEVKLALTSALAARQPAVSRNEAEAWDWAAHWAGLALISARYPGEFVSGIAWRFDPWPGVGWHAPAGLGTLPDGPEQPG